MIREVLTLERLRALDADEAAAMWLIRQDENGAEDRALFEEWLRDREANAVAWGSVQATWGSFDHAEDDDMLQTMLEAALVSAPSRHTARRGWLAAASVALAVTSAAVITGIRHGELGGPNHVTQQIAASPLEARGAADYTTARGQRAMVALPDGTRLTLDTASAVDVAFAGGKRTVRLLRGQAFFFFEGRPSSTYGMTSLFRSRLKRAA